jgi:hypothetical protein
MGTRGPVSRLVPARGKPPGFTWVPFTAHLRLSNRRHPRLQDCRLRWPAAAELRRAVCRPKVSGLMLDLKATAAEVTAGVFVFQRVAYVVPRLSLSTGS